MRLTGVSYNPSTGVMCRHGKPVANQDRRGYRRISIDGTSLLQHRVAWYLQYGYWPKEIDHINQDKSDNRLHNLRDGSRSDNMMNTQLRSDNKSGCKGVSWNQGRQQWQVKYKRKHLGWRKDLDDAIKLREEAVHGQD